MHSQDEDKTIVAGLSLDLSFSIKSEDGEHYPISDEISVGRAQDCDVVIDDKKISRKHAIIKLENNRLQLIDLNSSNGSFVNGKRVTESVHLVNADTINFDRYTYAVKIEVSQQPEPVQQAPDNLGDQTIIADFSDQEREKIKQLVAKVKQKESNQVAVSKKSIEDKKNIPGSWIEDQAAVDGTQMMGTDQIRAIKAQVLTQKPNDSNITCLRCFIEGQGEKVIELPVTDGQQTLGWEMGRDLNCDIVLNHPSVSSKHAQIIHKNGRWKVVNLVSTNGILINGQKKLSTYLADGDKINLGSVKLIFSIPNMLKKQNKMKNKKGGRNVTSAILVTIFLLALALLVFYYFNPLGLN